MEDKITSSPKEKSSHIEELIKITESIKDIDVIFFKDLIKRYFEDAAKSVGANVSQNELIKQFLNIPAGTLNGEFYYNKEEKNLSEISSESNEETINIEERKVFIINKNGEKEYSKEPLQYAIIARIAEILKVSQTDDDIDKGDEFFTNKDYEKQFQSIVLEILNFPLSNIENLKQFHEHLKYEIAYHFIKSFLNGEYLIFDDYSMKLIEIETNIIHFFIDKSNFTYPLSNELLTLIMISLSRANEACKYIGSFINKETNEQMVYIGGEDLARIRFAMLSSKTYYANDEECKSIKNIIKEVINMTLIDHCFYANNENVRKIYALYKGTQIILNNKGKYDNKDFVTAINQANRKAGKMLYDIQVANTNTTNKYDAEKYKLVFELHEEGLLSDPFGTDTHKHKKIKAANEIKGDIQIRSRTDLTNYNKFIEKGVKTYEELTPFFNSKKDITVRLEGYEENYPNRNRYPTFYLKAIQQLSEKIDSAFSDLNGTQSLEATKENIDYIKQKEQEIYNNIFLLKQLLAEFYNFMQDYATCPPPTRRPIFQDSFYNLETDAQGIKHIDTIKVEDYNFLSYKNHFFYASCNCKPINLKYLRSFYEKYKLKRKILSDKYYNYINKKQENVRTQTENAIKQTKQETENARKRIIQFAINKTREKTKEITRERAEQEKKTITLLGVFAAFLAFATGSIGFLKGLSTIYDFIVYSFTFTLALSVFVSILFDKFAKENKQSWKKSLHWLQYIFIVLWVAALAIRFYVGMPFIQQNESEDTKKVDINLSIQKTLQDILHKRSDTIHISSDQLPKQNTYNMNHKDTTNK